MYNSIGMKVLPALKKQAKVRALFIGNRNIFSLFRDLFFNITIDGVLQKQFQ